MSEPQAIGINDVRRAVREALAECFPDIPVADEVPVEPDPPCFVVRLLESGHMQELDRRFLRQYPFVIEYVDPDATDDDRYDAADRMSDALQWIEVAGRPVRGTGMKFRIEDRILHFSVEYRFRIWKPARSDPAMQTLDLREVVR